MSGIIFLHGASSSGKSTLARAVQEKAAEPFWHYSIDHLRDSGIVPMARFKRGDFGWDAHRSRFFEGFHRSVSAFADAGNNIILEHIVDTPAWLPVLREMLSRHSVLFVGLHVPLAELNRRETARGDRQAGSAEADFHSVHRGFHYDLEVDSTLDLDANAALVLNAWIKRPKTSGFFQGTPI